jgi:hypothetical protein
MSKRKSMGGTLRRSWRLLLGVAILAGAGVPPAAQHAAAEAVGRDVYVGLKPIPDAELRQLRGGLRIAGLDLDFGAFVQTYVNNIKVATTHLTLNNSGGINSSTTWSNLGLLPAGITVSGFKHDDTPIGLAGIGGMKDGVTVAKNGVPQSFAVNTIGLGQTTQAVINQIDNVAVKQVINTTLTINNFKTVQSNLLKGAALGNLANIAGSSGFLGVGP